MDVGTAVEIGSMSAQGKCVWGYTHVTSTYAERVTCGDGLAVESFGMADNLMVEGVIEASGGRLIRGEAPPAERYTWLAVFEACVHQLASSA